ncbi:unnamed protein product [Haemonchus placei]|uniref:CTCHY-type domain-containing protein n=1 Tax=Haemonchus placei TaxID=6290 RepID=A0A3P7V7F9_HAEPC|nr:unnamed protein product [Haemonchus placei]
MKSKFSRMDATACSFKAIADEHGNLIQEEAGQSKDKEEESYQSESKAVCYGCIPKNYSSALVFCHECVDVFEMKHKCPAEVVTRAQLRHPSRLLEAKDSCKGEAQFFFSNESIEILQGVVERSGVDGVLCLGAPRLFEELRGKKGEKRHLFLLDYDDRYARFFPATQFAQYSMLVDHFYDRKALDRLCSFFAECAQILLICDPPFGVFLEPLMHTVDSLRQRHKKARSVQILSMCSYFVAFPFTIEARNNLIALMKLTVNCSQKNCSNKILSQCVLWFTSSSEVLCGCVKSKIVYAWRIYGHCVLKMSCIPP